MPNNIFPNRHFAGTAEKIRTDERGFDIYEIRLWGSDHVSELKVHPTCHGNGEGCGSVKGPCESCSLMLRQLHIG